MATIHPFRAIRPRPEYAAQIASLPYDVLSSEEARLLAQGKPYSFLHVEKAEINLAPSVNLYDEQVYAQAREHFQRLLREGILAQEPDACFYIYRETLENRSQTGLVACTPIDDYPAGAIKVHEHTRPAKVQDRMRHIDACGAQTGLIFLAYRPHQTITHVMTEWMQSRAPVYDFRSDDQVGHTVWVIDDQLVIQSLVELFQEVRALYIADGHHRTASAVEFGQQQRQRFPHYTGTEEFNFLLAVLFPIDQLTIMEYNRVVSDLHGLTAEVFLEKIQDAFEVIRFQGDGPYRPTQRHTFGMYLAHTWYIVTARPGTFQPNDPVEALDSFILQQNLLCPILGIEDPRTNNRIEFIGGIRGLTELERLAVQKQGVAFALSPVSIDEVLAVADTGRMMPPKSTWFEPKLRSGLFIHQL
jgi:uncharacterized protein (DUF1015 family)